MKENKKKLVSEERYSEDNNGFSLFVFDIGKEKSISFFFEVEKNLRGKSTGYLDPLFNLNELEIGMLKFLPENSIYYYLDGFSDSDDWGKDRECFKKLLKKFKTITKNIIGDGVYLLNKDLYDDNESFIKFEEYHSYGYYIIFFWIFEGQMYVCEFTND